MHDVTQVELGMKHRGDKPGFEVKGLVSKEWGELDAAPFLGPIEIWAKWTSEALVLDSSVITTHIRKKRWIRKFSTDGDSPSEIELEDENPKNEGPLPILGCNVELTQITLVNGDIWWTFAFESFGALTTIAKDIRSVADLLASRHPPTIEDGLRLSYPGWLAEHA